MWFRGSCRNGRSSKPSKPAMAEVSNRSRWLHPGTDLFLCDSETTMTAWSQWTLHVEVAVVAGPSQTRRAVSPTRGGHHFLHPSEETAANMLQDFDTSWCYRPAGRTDRILIPPVHKRLDAPFWGCLCIYPRVPYIRNSRRVAGVAMHTGKSLQDTACGRCSRSPAPQWPWFLFHWNFQ